MSSSSLSIFALVSLAVRLLPVRRYAWHPTNRLHFHLRGELCDFRVDGNPAHERTQAVLLHFLSVNVEQHGESIVSGFPFLFHGFILLLRLTSFRMTVSACSSSASLTYPLFAFAACPYPRSPCHRSDGRRFGWLSSRGVPSVHAPCQAELLERE